MQLEAIASRPIATCVGEETNTCLTTTSFQVEVQIEVSKGCLGFSLSYIKLHQQSELALQYRM